MPSAVHHANAYNMKLKFKCVNVNSIPAVNKQHERTSSTPEGFEMDALT
jgi:hypothetical protein